MLRSLALCASLVLLAVPALAGPFDGSDNYKSHFEFLGYAVTEKGKALYAKHPKHLNVVAKAYNGGVLISCSFGSTEKAKGDRSAFLIFLNDLNRDSVAARFYADKDNDMIIEGWYPGAYDKSRFGIFLDGFNLVAEQLRNSPAARDYLQ